MRLVSPAARAALDAAEDLSKTNPVVTLADLTAAGSVTATPYVSAEEPGRNGIMSAEDKAKIDALGTAAYVDVETFAVAAQGAKADTAVQPDDLTGKTLPDYSEAAAGAVLTIVDGVPAWVVPT